jgi:hypothetical protein
MEGGNHPFSTSSSSVYFPTFQMTDSTTNSRQRISLGRIAPTIVLICLLLDASLRFLPPNLVAFRGWEALSAFATGNRPFIQNGFYWNPRSYGDLANLGNLPHMRQYREDVFTTDAEGYRNRREAAKPFQGILLLGDSFVAGAAVRDDQTLSEQLITISGCPVYNGGSSPNSFELLNHLQMTRGLVVWEQSERTPIPLLPLTSPPKSHWEFRLLSSVVGTERTELLQRLRNYSPLQITFGRAVRFFQNDKVLPNPFRGVAEERLSNGRQILFGQTEITNYELDRPTDPAYFAALKTYLEKQGVELLVLLVPDKYVVYHDLIMPPSPLPEREPFLDLVEERLVAADVQVVNLTPHFRAEAKTLLARDEYIYWIDDTHWNAEGIREAAQSIAESNTVSQLSCRNR